MLLLKGGCRMAWELSASPTCPLNGLVSTRCSDFRRSNRHSNQVSAGGGLRCRETEFSPQRQTRQNVPQTTDRRSQRPHGRTKARQLRAFVTTCRNSSQTVNCMVGLEGFEPPNRTL